MTTAVISNERAKELQELLSLVENRKGDYLDALAQAQGIADDLVYQSTPEERVIFRKFPHDGKVIALFPDQLNERNGRIMSYMHDGQHGETLPFFGDTKPCEDWADYADLYRELTRQGYVKMKIVKRFGKLGRK